MMDSPSSNSEVDSSRREQILKKRLKKLEKKYWRVKCHFDKSDSRNHKRSRSRSNNAKGKRRKEYRSPSGSDSSTSERGPSSSSKGVTRQHLDDRGYRSLRDSESLRPNDKDRVLHSSASNLSLIDHNLEVMTPHNDKSKTKEHSAEGNQVNGMQGVSEKSPSPVLQLHDDETLPDEFLEILGFDPEKKIKEPFSVHSAITSRWNYVGKNGLPKAEKEALLDRYPLPNNCSDINPPEMNLEMKNILTNTIVKRDTSYLKMQGQVCSGISGIAKALNEILQDKENIPKEYKSKLLEYLGDSGRILISLIHDITQTRRFLILPNVSKSVRDLIENIPPTEYLFGTNLSEKINNAKCIERTSRHLKSIVPSAITVQSSFKGYSRGRTGNASSVRPFNGPNNSLNGRRPARQQRETRSQKGHPSRGSQFNWKRQYRRT